MKKQLAFATLSAAIGVASVAAAQGIRLGPEELDRRSHVARSGDTLFDLAGMYLGDSLSWPQLWSYNPQITNPHWIYPGDLIYLEGVRPPQPPLRVAPEGGGFYPLAGFWTSAEFETYGELKYADTGRRLLAPLDTIYLELDDPESVAVGDTFAINRVLDRVYNDDDEVVAVKYLVTGMVEVTARHMETHLVSATITDLWDTIERGDVLFASQPQRLRVDIKPATVDLEAEIIDHLTPVNFMHEQDYVFINRGWEDGVEPGNRFVIWDRQDEGEYIRALRTRGLDYEEDIRSELPWQIVGEAMVIYTSDQYSTAIIVDAGMRELQDGMRLTLQAGH